MAPTEVLLGFVVAAPAVVVLVVLHLVRRGGPHSLPTEEEWD